MKSQSGIFIINLMLSALFVACSAATSDKQAQTTTFASDSASLELPLPVVPTNITDPSDRAAFIMLHFWDALQFSDTVRSLNDDFIEQNFSNFVSLIPLANQKEAIKAVRNLMNCAISTPSAYKKLLATAYKYLYDPNSPMYDEDAYAFFVDCALSDKLVDEAHHMRLQQERAWIAKNRVGMRATDFDYMLPGGTVNSLLKTPVNGQMILVLYDPECEECHDIMQKMAADKNINAAIASGTLSVLAINFTGHTAGHVTHKSATSGDATSSTNASAEEVIPATWTKGTDISGIEDRELYVIRATPSIYILDSSHTIVAKDIQPSALFAN